ncbi:hypothetical protein, partial [Streptomyces sp. IB201691-2A2]|uniref:hypothetical protein n=1 Tax=Streptomyces sp. IB201691-2A2 TaxID=2561920 RepID=UPI00163D4BA6
MPISNTFFSRRLQLEPLGLASCELSSNHAAPVQQISTERGQFLAALLRPPLESDRRLILGVRLVELARFRYVGGGLPVLSHACGDFGCAFPNRLQLG